MNDFDEYYDKYSPQSGDGGNEPANDDTPETELPQSEGYDRPDVSDTAADAYESASAGTDQVTEPGSEAAYQPDQSGEAWSASPSQSGYGRAAGDPYHREQNANPQDTGAQSYGSRPGYTYGGYAQNGYTTQSGYTQSGYTQNGYTQNGYTQGGYTQAPGTAGGYGGNYSVPQYSAPQPPKKSRKGLKAFLIILALVIVAGCVAIPVSFVRYRRTSDEDDSFTISEKKEKDTTVNDDVPEVSINKKKQSKSDGKVLTPAEIYEKIRPSIVAIMVYKNNSLAGEGTGVIYKEDDAGKYTYVLTCAHMFDSTSNECVVQLEDGTRYDAEICGYDVRSDIAVVRIKVTGLTEAELGDSDELAVGDPIYAIGNPGGSEFFGTFTDGIVSAIGRTITSSVGYDMVCIQHNAAISPGNSGGALVNEYGQVIGINSSKIAATDYEGISFAIPITQAADVINDVIRYGYVPGRAKLGITYIANNSSSLKNGLYSMVVQLKELPSASLVIYSIEDDSDLKNTNAKVGDMITKVNGKDMDTADVLLETIENASPGDTLTLTLVRISSQGGRYSIDEFDVKVKLIEETAENSVKEEPTTQFDPYDFFNFGF